MGQKAPTKRRLTATLFGLCIFLAAEKANAGNAYCLQLDNDQGQRQTVSVQAGTVTTNTVQNSPEVDTLIKYQGTTAYAFSPNFMRMAYLSDEDQAVLNVIQFDIPPMLNNETTWLPNYYAADNILWSNDGKWIVYEPHPKLKSTRQHILTLTDAFGHQQATISLDLDFDNIFRFQGFSPDDQYFSVLVANKARDTKGIKSQLRFFHVPDLKRGDLSTGMPALSTEEDSALVCDPSTSLLHEATCQLWARQGHRAVVEVANSNASGQLYIFTVGGDDLRKFPLNSAQLYPGAIGYYGDNISPDGTKVAIRSISDNGANPSINGRIDIFFADGRTINDVGQISARQIIDTPVSRFGNMVWSQDSQSLIYGVPGNAAKGLNAEIRRFNTDTSDDYRLIEIQKADLFWMDFRLSPSEPLIAFTDVSTYHDKGVTGILSLKTNSGFFLPYRQSNDFEYLAWSPDGSLLAYVNQADDLEPTDVRIVNRFGNSVYFFKAAGHQLARLWWTTCG